MSLRIRQIVLAASELHGAVQAFERELGLRVCYHDPEVAKFGLENAMLPVGDQFIEVLAPVRADSAVSRHLARNGDSAYMLILQTDDLDRDRDRLKQLGVRIVWESTLPDISAAHLHPKDVGAALVSLDEARPPESWRWAGPDWKQYDSSANARRIVTVRIAAADPQALAARWSEVLGLSPPELLDSRWCLPIDDGSIEFQRSTDGRELIVEYLLEGDAERTLTVCGTQFTIQ